MSIRGIGATMVIAGCTSIGLRTVQASKREIHILQELIHAAVCMESILKFQLTPLPELCRQTSHQASGAVREILANLAGELEWQTAPDVYSCMCEALRKSRPLSSRIRRDFQNLGRSLGQFDVEGQLKQLEGFRSRCQEELLSLSREKDNRFRSYRTLGICAGTALAILLL